MPDDNVAFDVVDGEMDSLAGHKAEVAEQSVSDLHPGQWDDDESGLHYNLNRYYDAETGQYLSTDSIGLAGGLRTQAYVHAPAQWCAPLGLAACADLRARVLRNIEASRAARTASQFDIHLARSDQVRWGYAADEWGVTTLKQGSRVYGGIPGQSTYYTSEQTLANSGLSRELLFQSLQVKPHRVFGYRPQMGVYEVVSDITGSCYGKLRSRVL